MDAPQGDDNAAGRRLGPDRGHHYSSVPEQAEPHHDMLAPPVRETTIISEGHWVESAPPRMIAGLLLFTAIGGLIASVLGGRKAQAVAPAPDPAGKGVMLPLRLDNGKVMLGPIRVATLLPLY